MPKTLHQHLFPIIDAMVDHASKEVANDGKSISCKPGCTHCCHLLIEVSWEEACELAEWVLSQDEENKELYLQRINSNAEEAKEFFRKYKGYEDLSGPITDDRELADTIYDDYFYGKSRPCPMLVDNLCTAYEQRPTSCRLHLVASDPKLCAADCGDDDEYDIPDEIEELKEHASHVLEAVEKDGRWGHFGIVLQSAIKEKQLAMVHPTLNANQDPVAANS